MAKATATSRHPATPVKKTAKRQPASKSEAATRFTSVNNPGRGRPKGSKNKTTQLQILAAREAFAPMAKKALDIGAKHLNKCDLDGCQACQWWGKVAFDYHYGKPSQPIEFDSVALRTELQSIAVAANKPVEEIEREAEAAGLLIMSQHRKAG